MSGETKWTEGPWVIDEETRPAEVCTVYNTSNENGFVYVRGELGYWGADENENWANAQLIAAAPELFKELERLVDAFESEIRSSYEGTSSLEVRLSETGAARAALAKARGESQ